MNKPGALPVAAVVHANALLTVYWAWQRRGRPVDHLPGAFGPIAVPRPPVLVLGWSPNGEERQDWGWRWDARCVTAVPDRVTSAWANRVCDHWEALPSATECAAGRVVWQGLGYRPERGLPGTEPPVVRGLWGVAVETSDPWLQKIDPEVDVMDTVVRPGWFAASLLASPMVQLIENPPGSPIPQYWVAPAHTVPWHPDLRAFAQDLARAVEADAYRTW